ncbi:MAG: hypothetical protein D6820_10730, partial [Lentisphaerae bacterium]
MLLPVFLILTGMAAIPGFFSHDELELLGNLKTIGLTRSLRQFLTGGSSGFFRPVSRGLEYVVLRLGHFYPYPAHLANTMVHVFNGVLLGILLRNILRWNWTRIALTVMLFLCCPLAMFAGNWFMGLEDMLYIGFALVCAINFVMAAESEGKWRWIHGGIAVAANLLALCCKETAVIIIPVTVVWIVANGRWRERRVWLLFIFLCLPLLGYLGYRASTILLMGKHAGGGYRFDLNPFHLAQKLYYYFIFPFYFRELDPAGWRFDSKFLMLMAFGAHLVLVILLGSLTSWRNSFLYLVMYFAMFGPVLLISKMEGQYLYGPAVVYSTGLAALFATLAERKWKLLLILPLGLLLWNLFFSFKIQYYMIRT